MAVDFVASPDAGDCDFHPIELLGLEKHIGEAASRLSPATMDRMLEIAWKQMIGPHHVLVHDYFDVDDMVVLDTVRVFLPSPAPEPERVHDEDGGA